MGTSCCGSRQFSEMGVHKNTFREQISKMADSKSEFVAEVWNDKAFGG